MLAIAPAHIARISADGAIKPPSTAGVINDQQPINQEENHMKTFLFTITSIGITLSLSACHNQNPLLKDSKKNVTQFIIAAQNYASKSTGLYDSLGSAYVACIENPSHFNPFKQSNVQCDRYLKAMLEYAHEHSIHFKHISLPDLKDPQVSKYIESTLLQYEV